MSTILERLRTFDLDELTPKQFALIIFVLFFAGAVLRFWNLGQFNELVFDETFFPKFAYDYMLQKPFFHSHPPLGKYTQVIGIWIYNHLPWVNDPAIGSVALDELSAQSWRWVNATFGSLLSLIVAFTVYRLTNNRLFTVLATLFVVVDGCLIVASRYGLSNVQILFFGFLSLLFLIQAVKAKTKHRKWLILCGIFLGCAYSVKWNGLGYSLIAWAVLFGGSICLFSERLLNKYITSRKGKLTKVAKDSVFRKIGQSERILYLVVLPLILYCLMWIPDFRVNSKHESIGFIGMHQKMLGFHSNEAEADSHPYCSRWYSWPLMMRPIAYYWDSRKEVLEDGTKVKKVHNVASFGNPLLYWMSALAVLWVFFQWLYSVFIWLKLGRLQESYAIHSVIVLGFGANFLPWSMVSRCTFLYHYQSASIFSFLALAWVTTGFFKSKNRWLNYLAVVIVVVVMAAFLYWLPYQLGIEITYDQWKSRIWLDPQWI